MVFKIEQLKSKNYIVYHSKYRFKEDWLLQAYLLKAEKAIDYIRHLDEQYGDQVRIIRESYICPVDRVYKGPAGFKIEFLNKKNAENYCNTLNQLIEAI